MKISTRKIVALGTIAGFILSIIAALSIFSMGLGLILAFGQSIPIFENFIAAICFSSGLVVFSISICLIAKLGTLADFFSCKQPLQSS